MNEQKLLMLPPNAELETKAVLKQLARANRALAELKGYADAIPNKHIFFGLRKTSNTSKERTSAKST